MLETFDQNSYYIWKSKIILKWFFPSQNYLAILKNNAFTAHQHSIDPELTDVLTTGKSLSSEN